MLQHVKYVYPRLPGLYCFPFFRVGGSGLANCLFVYGKAIVRSKNEHLPMITPSWLNLCVGPYLRGQSDKRHYWRLFKHREEISGLKKMFLLLFKKESVIVERSIYDFFTPLLGHSEDIKLHLYNHIHPRVLHEVEKFNFDNSIAVHVRLGDFSQERRLPLSWYKEKIMEHGKGKTVILFSDGDDDELSELLDLPDVKRVFFGNALADIIAMSRCDYIIGSNSSFSAWAAFLGQVPCCFRNLQFGILLDDEKEQVIEEPYV